MPIISDTEKKITDLHEWYCKRTGLVTKLCFSRQLWFERLRDASYDANTLRGQCESIVQYLKREIARDKRNLGALKLSNFLQPDTFDENLGLARLALDRKSRSHDAARRSEPRPIGEIMEGTEVVKNLRKFREGLKGPVCERTNE
jgi:hypothetical protein